MREIYRAGSQLLKVRAIMIASLACALGACWWGWDLFQTYGLRPADGGRLASLAVRLGLGLGVAALGIAFAAGMWAYGRHFVSALAYDEAAGALHVRTVGFAGSHETLLSASDVLGSAYLAGKSSYGRVSVDAPWMKVRVRGRRWPLIVDAKGEFPDRKLVARLLKLE